MANPRNATTTSRGRTYNWQDEVFDSVTTIIGGGVPKPALKSWGEKVVAEAAFDKADIWKQMDREEAVYFLKGAPFRSTDKAAARGSDVHEWVENHVLGIPLDIADAPPGHQGYLRSFLQFIEDWSPEYEMTEATVYNRKHSYAGTLDAILHIKGLGLCLIDYKTSRGVYGETALQLAAYRNAEFIGLPDGTEAPMLDVGWCGILHLKPKSYSLVPVEVDEEAFSYFLYAQQVRQFCEQHSRTVLGTPMRLEDLN